MLDHAIRRIGAHHHEKRGLTRRQDDRNFLHEFVIDTVVGERAGQGTGTRTDRNANKRIEDVGSNQ